MSLTMSKIEGSVASSIAVRNISSCSLWMFEL